MRSVGKGDLLSFSIVSALGHQVNTPPLHSWPFAGGGLNYFFVGVFVLDIHPRVCFVLRPTREYAVWAPEREENISVNRINPPQAVYLSHIPI